MPYAVVAGSVTAETRVEGGRAAIDFPRGAILPDDVPEEQIDALARSGAVALVEPAPAKRTGKSKPKGE